MRSIVVISISECKSNESVRWITVGVSKWLVNSTVNYLDESASKITMIYEKPVLRLVFLYGDIHVYSVVAVLIKW